MGTSIELLLYAPDGADARASMAAARHEIMRLEGLLSRFLPGSELSRLNRARRMQVGPDLARVLMTALSLRRRTGGRFDPTVGRAVVASGYDRSFDQLAGDPGSAGPAVGASGVVAIDPGGDWVALGPGVDLDFGAIAKGDAADRACEILASAGPCLVNAGGDITLGGSIREQPWPVGVATPTGELVVNLQRGALATSGVDKRRWQRGGRQMHHVIDPRAGECSDTDVVRATAIASTGADADALATALVVAGARQARRLADEWCVPAVIVDRTGTVHLAGGLA